MVIHGRFKRSVGAVVHPRSGDGYVAQGWGAERETVGCQASLARPSQVHRGFLTFARPELWYADIVMGLIGEQVP